MTERVKALPTEWMTPENVFLSRYLSVDIDLPVSSSGEYRLETEIFPTQTDHLNAKNEESNVWTFN
jgi:hypothetical protein